MLGHAPLSTLPLSTLPAAAAAVAQQAFVRQAWVSIVEGQEAVDILVNRRARVTPSGPAPAAYQPWLRSPMPSWEWYLEGPPPTLPRRLQAPPTAAAFLGRRPPLPSWEWFQEGPQIVLLRPRLLPSSDFVPDPRSPYPSQEWFLEAQAPLQALRRLVPSSQAFVPWVRVLPAAEWYQDPAGLWLPRPRLLYNPLQPPPPRRFQGRVESEAESYPVQLLYRVHTPQIVVGFVPYRRLLDSSWLWEDAPYVALVRPRLRSSGAPFVKIQGVTRDAAGAPLPGCTVKLFRTSDDVKVDQVISDGGGNFIFNMVATPETFYIVAYLVGGPDREGGTVNTLLPS